MLRIGPVPSRHEQRALAVLAGESPDGWRVSAYASMLTRNGPRRCRLWWARGLTRPRAAAMTLLGAGNTAMAFHSPADPSGDDALAGVLEGISRAVLDDGATFVQSLLSPDAPAEADAYARAGFERVARLAYLQKSLVQPLPAPHAELSWKHFTPADEPRLTEVIADTYVNSCDCPRLLGLRPMADVLAAHRDSGVFRPDWWWMPACDGEIIGCVLVNEVSGRSDAVDIVYLGVRPAFRQHGFARAMVRHALQAAARAGAVEAHLAVDSANIPAFGLYAAEGFDEVDAKDVFIRSRRSLGGAATGADRP